MTRVGAVAYAALVHICGRYISLFCVFLTCSWVTADLAAGIFHIYAGNRLRADYGSVFVGCKQMKSPFFNYQGLIVYEVLLLVFGFCFICSVFVVDVQAMVYYFCSLHMVMVHIVKSIR